MRIAVCYIIHIGLASQDQTGSLHTHSHFQSASRHQELSQHTTEHQDGKHHIERHKHAKIEHHNAKRTHHAAIDVNHPRRVLLNSHGNEESFTQRSSFVGQPLQHALPGSPDGSNQQGSTVQTFQCISRLKDSASVFKDSVAKVDNPNTAQNCQSMHTAEKSSYAWMWFAPSNPSQCFFGNVNDLTVSLSDLQANKNTASCNSHDDTIGTLQVLMSAPGVRNGPMVNSTAIVGKMGNGNPALEVLLQTVNDNLQIEGCGVNSHEILSNTGFNQSQGMNAPKICGCNQGYECMDAGSMFLMAYALDDVMTDEEVEGFGSKVEVESTKNQAINLQKQILKNFGHHPYCVTKTQFGHMVARNKYVTGPEGCPFCACVSKDAWQKFLESGSVAGSFSAMLLLVMLLW